jgi:hypothetical protein
LRREVLPKTRNRPWGHRRSAATPARSCNIVAVTYRVLAALPFVGAVAVLLVAAIYPDDVRWDIVYDMTRAAKVTAVFGCLVAGLSFQRGEHMRRGWLALAGCYGLLSLRDGILHRDLFFSHWLESARWIDVGVIALANALGVVSVWTLARAWKVSGVTLPGKAAWRGVAQIASVVMAMAITLPSLAIQVPHLFDGDPVPVSGVIGALADATSLALIAPVLMTALGLRGTRIAWPWALLAVSMFGWLVYDATFSLSEMIGVAGRPLLAFGDASRVLAATAACAGGLMQRLIATAEAAPARPRPR